jgi:hypothetical protein
VTRCSRRRSPKACVGEQRTIIARGIGEVGKAVRVDRVRRRQARDDEVKRRAERDCGEDEEGGRQPQRERPRAPPAPAGHRRTRGMFRWAEPFVRGGLRRHAAPRA